VDDADISAFDVQDTVTAQVANVNADVRIGSTGTGDYMDGTSEVPFFSGVNLVYSDVWDGDDNMLDLSGHANLHAYPDAENAGALFFDIANGETWSTTASAPTQQAN
jgi:hypothetical protein